MDEHPSNLVYQHLGKFLNSRNLKIDPTYKLDKSRYDFVTDLDHAGYYRVDAFDKENRIIIILLSIHSKYTDHGPNLRNLLISLVQDDVTEVIIITQDDVLKKKNITDIVVEANAKGSIKYYMYPYHIFSIDIPNVQIIPKHTLVSAEDTKNILTRERLQIKDLPMVSSNNAPIIWIGAKRGQMVKIEYVSETSCKAITYAVVH